MSIYNRHRKTTLSVTLLVSLAIIFTLTAASSVSAIQMVPKLGWGNTFEAQGSFAYGRRDVFRELYGNGVTFALRYERSIGQKTGFGVHVSRVQQCNADSDTEVKIKHRDLAITPMMTYSFVQTGQFRFFAGGGLGLSLRKITLETFIYDWATVDPLYAVEFDQTENTLRSLLMAGADIKLSNSVFLGGRLTYDRHFFDDAETGDLGDTGGFNFGGSLGFVF